MHEESQASTSENDKLTAALAHIGVIVPYAGILVPLLVWLTHRKKAPFVEFHALQALLYRIFLMLFPVFIWPLIMIMAFLSTPTMALLDNSGPSGEPSGINYVVMTVLFFTPFALAILFLLLILALVLYGLIAAALVYSGRNFRYPFLARIAERLGSHA